MKRTNIKKTIFGLVLIAISLFGFSFKVKAADYTFDVKVQVGSKVNLTKTASAYVSGFSYCKTTDASAVSVSCNIFGTCKAKGLKNGSATIKCYEIPVYIDFTPAHRAHVDFNVTVGVGPIEPIPEPTPQPTPTPTPVEKGEIRLLNLLGGALIRNPFTNCSESSEGQVCKYDVGSSYKLPSASASSYGTFIGWSTTDPTGADCSDIEMLSSGSSVQLRGGTITYYATYQNSCKNGTTPDPGTGGGGSTNPGDVEYHPVPTTGGTVSDKGTIDIDGLCDTYRVKHDGTYTTFTTGVDGNYNLHRYTATDTCTNDTYISICIDPTKTMPTADMIYRKVGPVNPLDDEPAFPFGGRASKAYEAFILSIVQKYYDQITSNPDYEVGAQLAFRTYFANLGISNGKKAYYSLARAWNGEDPSYSWTGGSPTVYSYGREMFQYGKQAGDACVNATKNNPDAPCNTNIVDVGLTFGEPDNRECENEDGELTKFVEGDIKGLNTFDAGGVQIIEFLGIEGFKYELEIDGTPYAVGSTLPSGGSRYKFKITGTREQWAKLKSEDLLMEFGIKVKATSKKDFHNVIAIRPINSNYQSMVLIRKAVPAELQYALGKFGDLTCGSCLTDPELLPPEMGGDSSIFNPDRFADECCAEPEVTANPGVVEAYCPEPPDLCADAKWAPVCDDNEEGSSYFFHEGINGEGGEIDYEKCVIDKEDAAGNTYNIWLDGAKGEGVSVDNPYCTVSCKEDWDFELPGKKYAAAGQYFLLSIPKIQGVRTCVTSLEIKNDEPGGAGYFENDIERINKALIKNYNDYAKASAYIDAWEHHRTDVKSSYHKCAYGGGTDCEYKKEDGTTGTKTVTAGGGGQEVYTYSIVLENPEYAVYEYTKAEYKDNGALISDNHISGPDIKTSSATGVYGKIDDESDADKCEGSDKCPSNSYKSPKDDYKSKIGFDPWDLKDSAATNIAGLLDQRAKAIAWMKECSNWKNVVKYEPEVRYVYAEAYYMDLIKGNNIFDINKDNTTDFDTNPQNRSGSMFCDKDSSSDKFECQGNKSESKDTFKYSYNVFECATTDGADPFVINCEQKKMDNEFYYNSSIMQVKGKVTNNSLIKGAWYTLHNSGDMEFSPEGDGAGGGNTSLMPEDGTPDGERKGKVMPVRLTTPEGEYEYQIMFNKVGQYNEEETLGRIIGGKNGKGAKSAFSALAGKYNLSQTYLCHYEVTGKLCHCCGDDIEYEIVSLVTCPSGTCGKKSNEYLDENGNLGFFTRSISVNNVFPNRDEGKRGSNWTDAKGQRTLDEIEKAGETIYDTPEYSFTFSSQGLVSLREGNYNYSTFDLTCDEKGMDCTSPFLDELKKTKGIKVGGKRYESGPSFTHFEDGTSWK